MMARPRTLGLLGATLAIAAAVAGCAETRKADGQRHSELWGARGELWRPDGRLPDFSHAGYRGGAELPRVPVAANVRAFGARGDGTTDDGPAFVAAIAAVAATGKPGAVWIPPGRYLIREVLFLKTSGVVLRGAGPETTTLVFPEPLFEALGEGPWGGPYGWSWGGGWIWAHGEFEELPAVARIVRDAARGATELAVDAAARLEGGDLVRLLQTETDGSLSTHLHADNEFPGPCWVERPGFRTIDWVVPIERVGRDQVTLARPLRVDVRTEWSPALAPFRASVREVGVEDLAIEFPEVPYAGHHMEPGYNAIYFHDVVDSWVQNVEVRNFDNAISFWHNRHSTARHLRLTGRGGHYAVNLGASQDSLVTDFVLENRSEHDLSVSNLANGNVFTTGRGVAVNLDHHRGAPYENLFSNIDLGESWRTKRVWASSGAESGHISAARETFWNLRPQVSTRWIPPWPALNVIGPLEATRESRKVFEDAWLEDRPALEPTDLYAAQVAARRR